MDSSGKEIKTVGRVQFGFDSTVDLDILQALYLRPHYVATHIGHLDEEEDPKSPHARFTRGLADYQSKSIYNPSTNTISYTTLSRFLPVRLLPSSAKKRILITGGAGFVGSHLVDRLMLLGHDVTVLDNFFTGSKTTVGHWVGHPNFEMVRHDVIEPFMIEVDREFLYFSFTSQYSQQYACFRRDISPRVPRLSSALPIQRRQDDQNVLYGHPQYARSRKTNQGEIFDLQHVR
jgi:UDP-glucuronate decarboxylase